MYSHLFRRETARRIRSVSDRVIDLYLANRFPWLDAYGSPSLDHIRHTIETIAGAVERADRRTYRAYADNYGEALIANDMPPIAILAAADLLYDAILQFLTSDQQRLVEEVIDRERRLRQSLMYDRFIGSQKQKGA